MSRGRPKGPGRPKKLIPFNDLPNVFAPEVLKKSEIFPHGISDVTLYKMLQNKEIPARRVGRFWYISRREIGVWAGIDIESESFYDKVSPS